MPLQRTVLGVQGTAWTHANTTANQHLLNSGPAAWLVQVQEAAATSVAMFAALLTAEHRREHLSAVIDALMHGYDGALLCCAGMASSVKLTSSTAKQSSMP